MNILHTKRLAAVLAALACIAPLPAARAQVIDIAWDTAGNFERSLDVAPGGFVELCVKLTKGRAIAWSYDASAPLDFNIHYHAGKDVVFPVKQDGSASLKGELQVDAAQDYCWMWRNKGAAPAALQTKLQRRR